MSMQYIPDHPGDLPQWQKDIIDENLTAIADNPERLRPIEALFDELNKED